MQAHSSLGFVELDPKRFGLRLKKSPNHPKPSPPPVHIAIWVLWSNNPQIFKKAQDMLAQKKSFSETATVLSKEGGEAVRSNLDCMPAKRMDPPTIKHGQRPQAGPGEPSP